MSYVYRWAAFVPDDRLSDAEEVAVAVFGDAPDCASRNFSVGLVSGEEAFWGGCGVMTEAQRGAWDALLPERPWLRLFVWDAALGGLVASVPAGEAGAPWGWEKSLEAGALVRSAPAASD